MYLSTLSHENVLKQVNQKSMTNIQRNDSALCWTPTMFCNPVSQEENIREIQPRVDGIAEHCRSSAKLLLTIFWIFLLFRPPNLFQGSINQKIIRSVNYWAYYSVLIKRRCHNEGTHSTPYTYVHLVSEMASTLHRPQLVMLTFDDSINDLNRDLYNQIFQDYRRNPNGCPIASTFFVSHEWTDYSQVQNLYASGHEIASHSIS